MVCNRAQKVEEAGVVLCRNEGRALFFQEASALMANFVGEHVDEGGGYVKRMNFQ